MKIFLERYSFLILLIFVMVGGFGFAYYAFGYEVGTDFTLCTSSVSQPACYPGAYPTPTVDWTVSGSSSQTDYQVQIDNNSNFNNPEIDTGTVTSGSTIYTVNESGLSYNTTYYWQVRIRDNFGSWSNWVAADSSFVTNDTCAAPPTIEDMSVSSVDSATYCGTAAHYFSWTYSDPNDDDQSRFQFQVDNNSNFSSPEVDRDYTGLSNPSPTVNNQTVIVAESPAADQIGYNTTYYWQVKVYDDTGRDSGWVSGSSFTTGVHRYPSISFVWAPLSPSEDEDVLFTDGSSVYGGATKSSWSWTFEDGNPAVSSDQNPIVQFTSDGSKNVVLEVTDSDGFVCDNASDPGVVNVLFELPEWEEVSPH